MLRTVCTVRDGRGSGYTRRGRRHIVFLPSTGRLSASDGGRGISSSARRNTAWALDELRAWTTRPVHEAAFTPRATQPGHEPKAPSRPNTTVAAACHTMCHTGISAVYQPAKKLGTKSTEFRAGRNALITRRAPT